MDDTRHYTYILDEFHNPVPCDDTIAWGRWFEHFPNRRVAKDILEVAGQQVLVTSVFLGIDHNFTEKGAPILFETMAFLVDKTKNARGIENTWGNELGTRRFATWDECLGFHNILCYHIKRAMQRGITTQEGLTQLLP